MEKDLLEQRRIELVKTLEAFNTLDKSKEWQTVKELVFDRSLASIERQVLTEALAKEIDVNKLYKLQGEHSWAKQYSDTDKFITLLTRELEEIKKRLQ